MENCRIIHTRWTGGGPLSCWALMSCLHRSSFWWSAAVVELKVRPLMMEQMLLASRWSGGACGTATWPSSCRWAAARLPHSTLPAGE